MNNNIKLNYFTKPVDAYVTVIKTENMLRAKTEIQCPLCQISYPKRDFEEHVYTKHSTRADEAFARLYGAKEKCVCGKDLHYNKSLRAFPKRCGLCASQEIPSMQEDGRVEYKNSDDAKQDIEALKARLAHAQAEEKRLKEEEELSKIPLEKLPFPSRKYNMFMRKLSQTIRISMLESDRGKVLEILNFLDSKLK